MIRLLLKRVIPQGATAKAKALLNSETLSFSALAAYLSPRLFGSHYRRATFRAIYKEQRWGKGDNGEFFSGHGSRGKVVGEYVDLIGRFIGEYSSSKSGITIVDLGCGDFAVGRSLTERIKGIPYRYIGCDIVPELIAYNTRTFSSDKIIFKQLDIVQDDLPPGDICLVRQVFQHLSNRDIELALSKLAIYGNVFITEGYPVINEGPINPDKPVGFDVRFNWRTGRGRGVELDQAPYNRRTTEICRVRASPFEEVITYKVEC